VRGLLPAAPRAVRRAARRGFSLSELLATLVVLLLVGVGVLNLLSRSTKLDVSAGSGLDAPLRAGAAALSRAIRGAGAGGLPGPALTLVDNTAEGAAFTTPGGARVAVRAGTDQVRLRGVLETPVLLLDPVDDATKEPVS